MKRFALVGLTALAAAACDGDLLGPDAMMGPLFNTEVIQMPFPADLQSTGGRQYINDAGQVIIGHGEGSDGTYGLLWQNRTVTKIGGLPGCGQTSVWVLGINKHGQVVGHDGGCESAFLWQNGKVTKLPFQVGWDINDAGQVVGWIDRKEDWVDDWGRTHTGSDQRMKRRAVVWHNGSMTELPELPGLLWNWGSSHAYAVNNVGQILGTSGGWKSDPQEGSIRYGATVIWRKGEIDWEITELTGFSADPKDINDAGQVIGNRSTDGGHTKVAVLWKNGNVEVLPNFPGGKQSYAYSINNAGQIVGEVERADGEVRAVIWENGTVTELSTLPGASFSTAASINNLGQIVGYHDDDAVVWAGPGSVFAPLAPSDPGATSTGSNVAVNPNDATTGEPAPVGLTFPGVTEAGTTTVTSGTLSDNNIPVPSGFRVGASSTYYEIKTTASFTGQVTVCIKYTEANYDAEGQVRLLHYEKDPETGLYGWQDITTSVDTATNTVCGLTSSFSPFMLAELNAAPAVTGITISSAPFALGTAVQMSARFTDANSSDTHTATINWGDGTSSAGVVTSGTVTVTGTRSYTAAGVYTVTVTVRDNYRGAGISKHEYVVVYDPSAGFVTGGGWIKYDNRACPVLCSGVAGKADFGFVSKYQKGATTPTGNTQFQFHAGNLNFRSTAYDWLVISGPKAQYKGRGTINGSGDYGFILTANDGQVSGGGGTDRFRIKITDRTTGQVVYDNQMGDNDDAGATMELGGGSIIIHSK